MKIHFFPFSVFTAFADSSVTRCRTLKPRFFLP